MYKLIRSLLFYFDAERVHYFSMNVLQLVCRLPFGKKFLQSCYKPSSGNHFSIFNLQFINRIGLAAGFDKNAIYLNELEALGFGFVEIGTVTPLAQAGNEKPRLFRLPQDKAIINRMGFNNDGVETVAKRLKKFRTQHSNSTLIIGGNIGKNKNTPNETAWIDYEICFTALHELVDYFVVNVSSPNTPGLRALQDKDALHKILTTLQNQNTKYKNPKPILLKIAPDLSWQQIDDVIELALEIKLDGLVACNTTISRNNLTTSKSKIESIGPGGLSGLPVRENSTQIIKYIYDKTNGQLPIIGSGGVFSAADAKQKLVAGASLVQVWTGFIYQGPGIVKSISKEIKN